MKLLLLVHYLINSLFHSFVITLEETYNYFQCLETKSSDTGTAK